MEESVRTFIALLINDELKNRLKQIQEKLRLANADVKWIAPEEMHLTLKFLGNTGISQIDDIFKAVSEVAGNFPPILISLSSVGAFPCVNCPQIIWVGIDEGKEIICEINHCLENKLAMLGFKKEKKRFNPHLTVGRVKGLKGFTELTKRIVSVETPVERMLVSDIHIMKSQLTPQGAIHSVLERIALKI
ncbi:MAG: RNA 2',3'-cyclic phosphodiesterase [bacterium]|nr:RNA 2',3'-cyclic phosphodiesterase [bacterium]